MVSLAAIFGSLYSLISLLLLNFISSYILIPGVSVLIASYAAFQTDFTGLLFFMFLVLVSSLAGDCSTYLVARWLSNPVRKFLKKFKWFNKNEDRVRKSLNEHEFSFVFFSRFLVSGTGPAVNYICGLEKLNAKKFFIAVLLGEMVFSIIYSSIGYIFKDTWQELINTVQYGLVAALLVVIASYLIIRIINYYKKRINAKSN